MVKPVIVKRLVKGSHLTFTELDQNFQNLDDATISIAVQGSDTVVNDLNDTTTFVGQDGIQITATASNQTISFDASLYMDTTPVLSADLDVNNFKIVNNATNGNIELDPNGTGRVVISGDLQVDGTTTTINSTTLDVDDKNITLSKGAPNAAASDGGGITVEGPTTAATLLYASADDSWNFNKKTSAPELQIDNINVNGNTITSTDTNGNITITPNGTGSIVLDGVSWPQSDGSANYVLKTNGSGQLSWVAQTVDTNTTYQLSAIQDGPDANIRLVGSDTSTDDIQLVAGSNISLSVTSLGGIQISASSSGLNNVVEDTTPQLGGNLDVQSYKISTSVTNGNITLQPDGTGKLIVTNGKITANDNTTVNLNSKNGLLTEANLDVSPTSITLTPDVTGSIIFAGAINVQTNAIATTSTNANITLTPNGSGYAYLNGSIKTNTTSGTPTNYENGYFEDMLATPVSWLKIRIGSSDYYLPLFQ